MASPQSSRTASALPEPTLQTGPAAAVRPPQVATVDGVRGVR